MTFEPHSTLLSISENAFSKSSSLEYVVIPPSVEFVRNNSFYFIFINKYLLEK